jgi:hypothetical protein
MSSNNIFSLNMKSLHNTTMRTEHVEESHLWPTLKRLEHTKHFAGNSVGFLKFSGSG